jgi:hypothetical protein
MALLALLDAADRKPGGALRLLGCQAAFPEVLLHQREMGGHFPFQVAVGSSAPEERDHAEDQSPHRRAQSHRLHLDVK